MDTLAARLRALRHALALTHDQIAARSGGRLGRVDLSKLEHGVNAGSSARIRDGLAAGLGLPVACLVEYLEGRCELATVLPRRPLSASILETYRAGTASTEDTLALLAVVGDAVAPGGCDPTPVVARWLDTVHSLRASGRPVTALDLAWSCPLESTG